MALYCCQWFSQTWVISGLSVLPELRIQRRGLNVRHCVSISGKKIMEHVVFVWVQKSQY